MKEITYRKKRNIRRKCIGVLVGLVILAALVVFGLFRVQEMVVRGNSIYTASDIENAIMQDGLCKNSLYLLWKFQDSSTVEEELPFLSAMEIQLLSPFQVEVRVYEKPEIGYFLNGTNYVYFDRDGLIVEISKKQRENIPKITGVTLSKPERYELLPIVEEDIFDATIRVTQVLSKNNLVPNEIKFDEDNNITLYFDKARVKLGTNDVLEEKIAALASVYDNVSTMEGILHMETFTTDSKTLTFKQGETEASLEVETEKTEAGEETESETETETEGSDTTGPTYSESDGTFSTDADGNKIYTDAAGNTTPNADEYQYTDENGEIITDGYGYIDPYTGAYILGR